MTRLRGRHESAFCTSLDLRFVTQVVKYLRICFVLGVLAASIDFPTYVLVVTFASLFTGLFFFSPVRLNTHRKNFTLTMKKLTVPKTFKICAKLVAHMHRLV